MCPSKVRRLPSSGSCPGELLLLHARLLHLISCSDGLQQRPKLQQTLLVPPLKSGVRDNMAQAGRSMLLGPTSAVAYGFAAVSMNVANKAALQRYPCANIILFIQMAATMVILLPLQAASSATIPPLTLQKARQLIPVAGLYCSNVAFALLGLQSLNIPMYNTLKRLTPMLVLGAKAIFITKKVPAVNIMSSVALVVGGCIIAGIGDFSFDPRGYAFALTSCVLQASYLLLVERSGADKGLGPLELMLYVSLLSLPFLVIVVFVTGEAAQAPEIFSSAFSQYGMSSSFLVLASCSGMGILLNYSIFLATLHNSALTTTIVGVLKGVVATLLGFFVLGGVEPHVVNVLGIFLNTAGGVWYTVIKYRRKAINLTQHDRDGVEQELLQKAPGSRVEHQTPLSAGPSTTALHSLIERRPSGVV